MPGTGKKTQALHRQSASGHKPDAFKSNPPPGGLTHKLPSCQQDRPRVSELKDLQGVALGRAQATHGGLRGLGGQYQLLFQVP